MITKSTDRGGANEWDLWGASGVEVVPTLGARVEQKQRLRICGLFASGLCRLQGESVVRSDNPVHSRHRRLGLLGRFLVSLKRAYKVLCT